MADRRKPTKAAFRPRARILRLLGDQLIRDPGIAVFELVKNAYDADATTVTVTLHDVVDSNGKPADSSEAFIVVEDDGSGMSRDIIENVWLEPGTDFREQQRLHKHKRSPVYKRLPLGEKGVGRFAADKLGSELILITRARRQREVVVAVDWDAIADEEYLDSVKIDVRERVPVEFRGSTGTRLEIRRLRQPWTRALVRQLHRSIESMRSPFREPGHFEPRLVLDPDPGWLDGLLTAEEVRDQALFSARGELSGSSVTFDYEFTPPRGMKAVKGRRISGKTATLSRPRTRGATAGVDLDAFEIGPVRFDLLIFDRDPSVLAYATSDKAGLREYLDMNGGIRVYRDGIRVYDYGEPGNDWLSLDASRVNVPAERLSNNIVIGGFSLDLASSTALVEKTNREGFVENEAFQAFRDAARSAIQQVAQERNYDKGRIRKATAKGTRRPVIDAIDEFRAELGRRGLLKDLDGQLEAVERSYNAVRETLMTAAGAGLTMSMVVHEVEKGVAQLSVALDRGATSEDLKQHVAQLSELITGLTYLIKKTGYRNERASVLVRQSLFNLGYRLEHHNVLVRDDFSEDSDFEARCVRRLVVATLMNLIDNSLWWLNIHGSATKRLYLGPSWDFDGPAIVVADNGPGFQDPPDMLTQPFMTRKPDGMGLGLHLADQVMASHGGTLVFPGKGDVSLPRGYSGAVVALVFKAAE